MKVINSKVHGIIDYVVVIFLLAAPSLFHLPPVTTVFTYALAAVYLVLTLLTQFEVGLVKVIPFKIHGWIEVMTAVVIVVTAIYLDGREGSVALYFLLAVAAINFIVWILTDFNSTGRINDRL